MENYELRNLFRMRGLQGMFRLKRQKEQFIYQSNSVKLLQLISQDVVVHV